MALACGVKTDWSRQRYTNCKDYNYTKHNHKKISYIKSVRLHSSGYDIVIFFTDGTRLNIWSYKYPMRIYE
jgi:hypothetical protein